MASDRFTVPSGVPAPPIATPVGPRFAVTSTLTPPAQNSVPRTPAPAAQDVIPFPLQPTETYTKWVASDVGSALESRRESNRHEAPRSRDVPPTPPGISAVPVPPDRIAVIRHLLEDDHAEPCSDRSGDGITASGLRMSVANPAPGYVCLHSAWFSPKECRRGLLADFPMAKERHKEVRVGHVTYFEEILLPTKDETRKFLRPRIYTQDQWTALRKEKERRQRGQTTGTISNVSRGTASIIRNSGR